MAIMTYITRMTDHVRILVVTHFCNPSLMRTVIITIYDQHVILKGNKKCASMIDIMRGADNNKR